MAAAEAEVPQEVIEKTKKELGAVIKHPKLSDKLLKKPPFRFLHDIVTSVIKTSGFAAKLYTDDERNSAKVTEKEAKVFFLQKIISSVNYTLKLQPPLAAKPIKIVSGLEAEATNEFLQKLAAATKVPIEKSDRAVSKVLDRLKDKARQVKEADQKDPAEEEKKPAAAPSEKDAGGAPAADADEKKREAKRAAAAAQEEEQQAKANALDAADGLVPSSSDQPQAAPDAVKPEPAEPDAKPAAAPAPIERREERKKAEVKPGPETTSGPHGVIIEKKNSATPKGGDKGALDTDSEEEEGEQADAGAALGNLHDVPTDGEEGYLAKLAADKKAAEEAKLKQQREAQQGTLQEETTGIVLTSTRHRGGREKEVFSTEVSKLKESLQALVKITNPLGKAFDFVQEDIDSMSKERTLWKRQGQEIKVQAQEAEHVTEEALQPLYSQIQDLEDAVSDQLNKIYTTRANIIKNDMIIETLLKMVAR
ncbi:hypothetical protein DIPPA_26826 [Diplonema papillatum]|nr:hypothetical protein DIPPA_26826 [Diplonema papillatum]KAJ9458619.1 hypothetical protein DIPPA_26826 [Diplonema papillatum]KAJ9458620.1 hypothetical protein DIPPA_26826 [Diplonema papillatum]KAJ9458621.1 hypothetical protein DIPPA_26826 [Diplonema papillatum]